MQETQETQGSIPGSVRSPGGGNGNPLQYYWDYYYYYYYPVLLPGKSHGQRSLEGYSLWDHKET